MAVELRPPFFVLWLRPGCAECAQVQFHMGSILRPSQSTTVVRDVFLFHTPPSRRDRLVLESKFSSPNCHLDPLLRFRTPNSDFSTLLWTVATLFGTLAGLHLYVFALCQIDLQRVLVSARNHQRLGLCLTRIPGRAQNPALSLPGIHIELNASLVRRH